jgi:hypothetical protein
MAGETQPESIYKSFLASRGRLEVLQRLTLEFAGVVIEELPTSRPDDFMKHIRLTFSSVEQSEVFIRRMLELQR